MDRELPIGDRNVTDRTTAERPSKRPAANVIHLAIDLQRFRRDPLKLLRAEERHDAPPLADGSRADVKRPSNIRGTLEVIDNVLFEHTSDLTAFKRRMQPHLSKAALTLVDMDRYAALADRLREAMRIATPPIKATELAQACDVSDAAVSKWLDGGTKKLSADNYAAAARALGVREEWLRTGRLPMEREFGDQEREIDQIVQLLDGLQEPLSELVKVIDRLRQARPRQGVKRQKA